MPLKWTWGRNPFVDTHLGRLGLGPNATAVQVVHRASELKKKLASSLSVSVGGLSLDEHAVEEARASLLENDTLARELVLVHPQTQRQSLQLRDQVRELEEVVTTSGSLQVAVELNHALCLLWFLPAAWPEPLELPELEAFELVGAGDTEDLALDVVFDV